MILTELHRAFRTILRSPHMALAAVCCIGLGTAAVTAVVSLLHGALYRPLPFPESDRLVRVWMVEDGGADRLGLAFADVADLRSEVPAFERVEAATRARLVFLTPEGGRRTEGEAVTAGYFELVGATLSRGRYFSPEEHAGGGGAVMVLSHEAWGTHFGHADDAIGSTISTPDAVYTVVGVLAPSFTGTIEDDSGDLEFWVPARPYLGADADARNGGNTWAIARLQSTESMLRAQSEVAAAGERIAGAHPRERATTSLRVEPLSENWRAGMRQGVWLLFIAAGLLLAVGATNMTGLMLAQGIARQREVSVRMALGARRVDAVMGLALEAALLTVAGGTLGIILGPVILRVYATAVEVPVPAYITLAPSRAALLIAFSVLAVTTIAASLIPALLSSSARPMQVLRGGGRNATQGGREQRWGRAVIVLEVALTTVLLTTTALLVRSYQSLAGADLGYRTERMLRVALFVNTNDAPEVADVAALQQAAYERVQQLPGVEAVARVWPTVPILAGAQTLIRYPGMDERRAETGEPVVVYATDAAFFDVLEIPVRAGRAFTESDRLDTAPVAVVSTSLAARFGGSDNAIGRTVNAMGGERRIVGVVGDAALAGPRAPAHEQIQLFVPLSQAPNRTVSFAIRTAADDPAMVLPSVRRTLAGVAPTSAIDWTDSYTAALGDRLQTERFVLSLASVFTTFTLVLAALGLFAVFAYDVSRRRVEIAVRQAMGATPTRILRSIMTGALVWAGVGLGAGFVMAVASASLLRGMLFGIGALDPLAFAGAALVIVVAALVASGWPAASAAGVPPAVALRSD